MHVGPTDMSLIYVAIAQVTNVIRMCLPIPGPSEAYEEGSRSSVPLMLPDVREVLET